MIEDNEEVLTGLLRNMFFVDVEHTIPDVFTLIVGPIRVDITSDEIEAAGVNLCNVMRRKVEEKIYLSKRGN